jgi:putative serine protease PepD
MASDDDADDLGGFGQPLPPDDRLWRHPSELAGLQPAPGGGAPAPSPGNRPLWGAIVAAGLAGAVLATGLLAVSGELGGGDRVVERHVVERVAVSPMVSAPTTRGDLGVVRLTDQVRPSVAAVEVATEEGGRSGSAVLYRDDGHLLTSATLVEGATGLVVVAAGRRLPGRVVGADPSTDIAVVKVDLARTLDGTAVPSAVLGDGASLAVGQPAVSIGLPGHGGSPVVASGVVSALGLRLERQGADPLYGMIQIDVPVAAGAVGGPVLDSRGAVIGIASGALPSDGRFGFAVPIDVARRVADDLLDDGEVDHCWLGIEGVDLDAAASDRLHGPGGAVVLAVVPSSPASTAGLQATDVIAQIDGRPLDGVSSLVAELRRRLPGDQVLLGLWRGEEWIEVTATLGVRP